MGRAEIETHVARVRTWVRDPSVCVVHISGAGTFQLDAATARTLGLTEGASVDAQALARIADAAARREAKAIALRLLQRRLRSQAELESALRRRGVSRHVAAVVMADLARAGWIDDARFAQALVRDRLALRPSGQRRLRAELLARGVAPEVTDAAIRGLLSTADEEGLAVAQARLRLRRLAGLPPEVARRRLIGWLQRRGFAGGAIVKTLRALRDALPDEVDAHTEA